MHSPLFLFKGLFDGVTFGNGLNVSVRNHDDLARFETLRLEHFHAGNAAALALLNHENAFATGFDQIAVFRLGIGHQNHRAFGDGLQIGVGQRDDFFLP